MANIVEIVYAKNKLKAQVVGTKYFCKFPNKLRENGKLYEVEILQKQKNFYVAKGTIQELVRQGKFTDKGDVAPNEWYLTVSYELDDYFSNILDIDSHIIKLAEKLGFEESGSGAGFGQRDVSFTIEGEKDFVTTKVAKLKKDLKKILKKAKVDFYEMKDD